MKYDKYYGSRNNANIKSMREKCEESIDCEETKEEKNQFGLRNNVMKKQKRYLTKVRWFRTKQKNISK